MIGMLLLGFCAGVCTGLGVVALRVSGDDPEDLYDGAGWDETTADYVYDEDEDDYVYEECNR